MKKRSPRALTRRDFLKFSGIAAVTGFLSCAGSRIASAQKPSDELVVAFSGDPGHMDPMVEAGGIGWSTYAHMFETCVFKDVNTNPIPMLVVKWEQLSPTVLRWHLRKGVKFHNGEEFTAESVKLSIEKVIAPGSRSPSKSRVEPIKEMKIPDPYTIDLITDKPTRPLLRNTTNVFMISPRAVREFGEKISTNPVGTGQMKFVEYRPGQHVLMEANPDYWGKKSNFKRLRIRFIPENGTRVAALETEDVMMINNVPPDQITRLRANPNLMVHASPTNRVMYVMLRCDRAPFNNKLVRQAMNYAVDKEGLTKGLMGGMAHIAQAPLARGVFGTHPGLPVYTYDPDRAKKMLTEAGAIGASFNFGVAVGRYVMDKQVGEAIAGYLSAVGLNVKFEAPDWGALVAEFTKYEKSKYDGILLGWGVINGEPDMQMWDHYHSKALRRTMYSNPEVDRLLDEARVIFDEDKVKQLYHKAQEIVWDECPWLWLYEMTDICASNKKLLWSAGRRDEFYLFHDASFKA